MRDYIGFERSTRGTGSESRTGQLCLVTARWLKIKKSIQSIDAYPPRCAGREPSFESTRRVDYNVVKAVRNTGVEWRNRKWRNRIGPRIRDNPCVLHTVEINILIFSLGRYAHRALLKLVLKKNKKETIVASGSANRTVGCLRGRLRRDVKTITQPGKCCLRVPRQKHNAGRSF